MWKRTNNRTTDDDFIIIKYTGYGQALVSIKQSGAGVRGSNTRNFSARETQRAAVRANELIVVQVRPRVNRSVGAYKIRLPAVFFASTRTHGRAAAAASVPPPRRARPITGPDHHWSPVRGPPSHWLPPYAVTCSRRRLATCCSAAAQTYIAHNARDS